MVGKTKMDGPKLQAKNNKWYRYITLAQLLVFAAMHLILGMYFAFVSSIYANHPGFTAKIAEHKRLDTVFAVVCIVLFVLWLRLFLDLKKNKKISVLYYISMAVSAVLPFAYLGMSSTCLADAMRDTLVAGYPEVIVDGVGDASWITFWSGVEFGAWANGGEITHESQVIADYLSKIGVEAGAQVELAKFDMGGLLAQFRNEMYAWNKFEVYAIINAVVTAAFVACGIVFLPLKKFAKK